MTDIQIIHSMNQSIINKITEYKNKTIKNNELNNFMLVNLCHILKTTNKIKAKNRNIQKKQDIVIKKSLSKIRSYHGRINYNPKELEANPIMKALINPTLESYIPLSELSYSTEIQLYKKDSDKCNFNESLLFNKNAKKEEDNEEKDIDFEEPPILYLRNTNDINKMRNNKNKNNNKNSINEINNENENDIIELINKDDEELFEKKENENQNQSFLFYELINSFDEDNKEDFGNDDIGLDFKKIESLFYLDDIYLNQRLSKRNSTEFYNNLSTTSGSTSFGSNSNSRIDSKINVNKEFYDNEFRNYMSFDSFNKSCEQMSIDYLRYLLVIYSNIVNISNKCYYSEKKMFISLLKIYILKIGISSKKIYDKINSNLINNKERIYSFETFVKIFLNILKQKDEYSILKYIFILSLFRFREEDINVKHINIFLQLIKGKLVFNNDLYDELSHNLIQRYDRLYSNEIGTTFKYRNILICLETFFDKNTKH